MLTTMTVQELDQISFKLKMFTENNFATVTLNNVIKTVCILTSQAAYDKVRIAQEEIGVLLKVSQNRVSDYVKIAKDAGLITVDMICRCGDIRNEYTLLDNPVTNSIKDIIRKAKNLALPQDSKEDIYKAIEDTISFYKMQGIDDVILQEVKLRIQDRVKSVKGVFNYFKLTLRTVKKESIPKVPNSNLKQKNDRFNSFEQRPFDESLEDKLLGHVHIKHEDPSDDEGSNIDIKKMLSSMRE
jgi:hypothetical protein